MRPAPSPFLTRSLTPTKTHTLPPPKPHLISNLLRDLASLKVDRLDVLREITEPDDFRKHGRAYITRIREISAQLLNRNGSVSLRKKRHARALNGTLKKLESVLRKPMDTIHIPFGTEMARLAYTNLFALAQKLNPNSILAKVRAGIDCVPPSTLAWRQNLNIALSEICAGVVPPSAVPQKLSPGDSLPWIYTDVDLSISPVKRQEKTHTQPTNIFRVDKDRAKPPGPGPHSLRNSAVYFPLDPSQPHKGDVLIPLPEGDEAQYTTANGHIESASFYALVCLLTSKQSILDHELTDITMRFFRIFASSSAFLAALLRRYNTKCPDYLMEPQERVWENNQTLVRIRVLRAMLMWLEYYWLEEDRALLQDMNNFIHKYAPKDLLYLKLKEAIKVKLTKRDKPLPNLPIPTQPWTLPLKSFGSFADALEHLNTPSGRETLARQLTLLFSFKFRQLRHLDAVEIWKTARTLNEIRQIMKKTGAWTDSGSEYAHLVPAEKALNDIKHLTSCLSNWVSNTIVVALESSQTYVVTIRFWLHVASRCIHHHNYVASRSIVDGVVNNDFNKRTQWISPLDKEMLKKLCRRLNVSTSGAGTNYNGYEKYEKELADELQGLPTLPLLGPLSCHVYYTSYPNKSDEERGNMIHLDYYRRLRPIFQILDKSLIEYDFQKEDHFSNWIERQLHDHDRPRSASTLLSSCRDKSSIREFSHSHKVSQPGQTQPKALANRTNPKVHHERVTLLQLDVQFWCTSTKEKPGYF